MARSQAPAEAATLWTWGHCVSRFACVLPSLRWRQIILLGHRSIVCEGQVLCRADVTHYSVNVCEQRVLLSIAQSNKITSRHRNTSLGHFFISIEHYMYVTFLTQTTFLHFSIVHFLLIVCLCGESVTKTSRCMQVLRRRLISTCTILPTRIYSLAPSRIWLTVAVAHTWPMRCDWPWRIYSTRHTEIGPMPQTLSFLSPTVNRVTQPLYSAKWTLSRLSVSGLLALALEQGWAIEL